MSEKSLLLEDMSRVVEPIHKVRDDLSEELSMEVGVGQIKSGRWESFRQREERVWRIHGKREHGVFKELKNTEYSVKE